MKLNYLLLAIASMGGSIFITPAVLAQCVQADIAVQYNISGSTTPTERDNDVRMQSRGGCRGNASITTGLQGNEGGTIKVRQSRKVRHRSIGDNRWQFNNSSHNNLGDRTVQIISNPTIDVYNAADNL